MPLGFLVVFSEPGNQVTLEEFQDWYNNEHVPLRLNYLKSFLTGARFSAADSLKPSWLALYDIDDTSAFQHESYTRLRANRSPREADLVVRLEVLDRRTCEALSDSGVSPITSSLASSNPTTYIVTHGIEVTMHGSIDDWTKDMFERLRSVKGWVRTRSFKCIDNLKTGTSVSGKGPEEQIVSKYFILHEFENPSAAVSSEFNNIIASCECFETVERRSWNLYRAYPGIAQSNLPQ
ncbi:hypothetical protein C0992_011354 [Termitomyces sp. T32_za158]|nr:hypothetical protein C0992_011354 [Termitomyces sp. T32_za158]